MVEELDTFASAHSSITQIFFGIFAGALLGIAFQFWIGDVKPENEVAYKLAIGILVLISLFTGLLVFAEAQQAKSRVKKIRTRRVVNPGESA